MESGIGKQTSFFQGGLTFTNHIYCYMYLVTIHAYNSIQIILTLFVLYNVLFIILYRYY